MAKHRHTGFSLYFILTLTLCALTQGQATALKPVPTIIYTDPATHVSFVYPLAWKRVDKVGSYLPAPSLDPENSPELPGLRSRALVQFSPDKQVYGHTNLVGLVFSYQTFPITSNTSCGNNIVKDIAQDEPSPIQINSVTFQHASTGDAAMCHENDAHLYWTAKAGTCHIFETAFLTLCPNNGDGHRTLTSRETRALNGHLNDIVQSIRLP